MFVSGVNTHSFLCCTGLRSGGSGRLGMQCPSWTLTKSFCFWSLGRGGTPQKWPCRVWARHWPGHRLAALSHRLLLLLSAPLPSESSSHFPPGVVFLNSVHAKLRSACFGLLLCPIIIWALLPPWKPGWNVPLLHHLAESSTQAWHRAGALWGLEENCGSRLVWFVGTWCCLLRQRWVSS